MKFSFTPFVLMMALSVHSLFEGIAVGLADESSEFWEFALAITLHKWAEAMSLCVSMSKNFKDDTKLVMILIGLFSCATPLGVLIGMKIHGANELINIVFSSLAGGTFLYIAASEVVVEEFSVNIKKWTKLLFFVGGALFITFLAVYME